MLSGVIGSLPTPLPANAPLPSPPNNPLTPNEAFAVWSKLRPDNALWDVPSLSMFASPRTYRLIGRIVRSVLLQVRAAAASLRLLLEGRLQKTLPAKVIFTGDPIPMTRRAGAHRVPCLESPRQPPNTDPLGHFSFDIRDRRTESGRGTYGRFKQGSRRSRRYCIPTRGLNRFSRHGGTFAERFRINSRAKRIRFTWSRR
jgi:hypothetical protein